MSGTPGYHREPQLSLSPSEVVFEWDIGTFVENIAINSNDDIFVTIHNQKKVALITRNPSSGKYEASTLAEFEKPPAGIAISSGGGVYVASSEIGVPGGSIVHVDKNGVQKEIVAIPDALFLNGFTPLSDKIAFVVDSLLGKIYKINLEDQSSVTWIQDTALTKISDVPLLPGINGIKVYNNFVYFTNTDRAQIYRIPILPDGTAGQIELVADEFRGDDFAFSENGNLYVTTHIHESVVRLTSSNGERATIAGPQEGLQGSTAAAFGQTEGNRETLFVTTTGGIINPSDGVIRNAKLVKINVGERGLKFGPLI